MVAGRAISEASGSITSTTAPAHRRDRCRSDLSDLRGLVNSQRADPRYESGLPRALTVGTEQLHSTRSARFKRAHAAMPDSTTCCSRCKPLTARISIPTRSSSAGFSASRPPQSPRCRATGQGSVSRVAQATGMVPPRQKSRLEALACLMSIRGQSSRYVGLGDGAPPIGLRLSGELNARRDALTIQSSEAQHIQRMLILLSDCLPKTRLPPEAARQAKADPCPPGPPFRRMPATSGFQHVFIAGHA